MYSAAGVPPPRLPPAPYVVVLKATNTPGAVPPPQAPTRPFRWWIPATIVAVVVVIAVIVGGVVGGLLGRQSTGALPGSSAGSSATPAPTSSVRTIVVQSANTKQSWMNLVAAAYNAAGFRLSNGQIAAVTVANTGSGLTPSLRPTIWSPNAINWLTLQESTQGYSLVSNKAALCPQ